MAEASPLIEQPKDKDKDKDRAKDKDKDKDKDPPEVGVTMVEASPLMPGLVPE